MKSIKANVVSPVPTKTLPPALSKPQAELLAALKAGVPCHYMTGLDAYYYRSDTHMRCTRQVHALLDRGLVKKINLEPYSGRHSIVASNPAKAK